MRIMKGVERILFGVNCLLWGIFALDILLTCSEGRCGHCFDFEECRLEMSVYGLTAAWLVAGGIAGRGILGRWGKWTCAVFWGVAALAHWACSRQIGWPDHYQMSTLLATHTLSVAFFALLPYCLVRMVSLKDGRGWLWRVLTVGWLWLGVMVVYENGKYIFALDVACTNTFCGCCWLILVVVCGYGVIRCVIRWFTGIRKLVKKSRREDVFNYINENER